jgi:hypothetical protein
LNLYNQILLLGILSTNQLYGTMEAGGLYIANPETQERSKAINLILM